MRDGNGLIDGSALYPLTELEGETGLFWQDISSASAGNLIEGSFPNSGGTAINCSPGFAVVLSTTPGSTYIGAYLPAGKIGHGTFVYPYETSGFNWYGLSAATSSLSNGVLNTSPSIPVVQAYNVDKKVDDGLPTTGAVQTFYLTGANYTASPSGATDTTTTCYNTTNNAYSVSSLANYGAGGNCALSFRFQ